MNTLGTCSATNFKLKCNFCTIYDISAFFLFFIVKQAHQMSFEGFRRYMDSSECLLFDNKYDHVYQDMTHPLTDYFISSSHNTYLISDQLWGPSDLWGYIRYFFQFLNPLHLKHV